MKSNTDKCKIMHIGTKNLEEDFNEDKSLVKIKKDGYVGLIISSNFKISKQG